MLNISDHLFCIDNYYDICFADITTFNLPTSASTLVTIKRNNKQSKHKASRGSIKEHSVEQASITPSTIYQL